MTITTDTAFESWQAWRVERTRELSRPHGWLSLTGLHWLDSADSDIEGLPGRWRSVEGGVLVTARADDAIVLDGVPVEGEVGVRTVEGAAGVLVEIGERRVEVMQRSGLQALRVRDPHAPVLARFRAGEGVPVFDYDPAFRVEGSFQPFEQARDVVVGSVVAGLSQHQNGVGTVTFPLGGAEQELLVFRTGTVLSVHFTDATSGVSTSGTTRSLALAEPATGVGPVILEFNRTQNLPCAFTDHATCPLPPAQNRLQVPVAAGEKDPR